MTWPGFLVIGAGRSGTTSLHHYLGQHPDVFLPPVKSPSHFLCPDVPDAVDRDLRAQVRNMVADPREYEALFDGVTTERAAGEVSPGYLASVHVAPRIARRIPDARLIAILRNPVDRAWARFVGRRRDGLEPRTDFHQIIRDELREPLDRDVAFGTYLASGVSHRFLSSYFASFPREQIRIHLFEDLTNDPAAVAADLFSFIGVDPGFAPDTSRRHNRSGGVIRSPVRRWLWTRSVRLREALRPALPQTLRDVTFDLFASDLERTSIDPDLRGELTALFRQDTERLQELLGRDLSRWLEPAP